MYGDVITKSMEKTIKRKLIEEEKYKWNIMKNMELFLKL